MVETTGSECAFLSYILYYILLRFDISKHHMLCPLAVNYSVYFVKFTFFVEKSWMIVLYIY